MDDISEKLKFLYRIQDEPRPAVYINRECSAIYADTSKEHIFRDVVEDLKCIRDYYRDNPHTESTIHDDNAVVKTCDKWIDVFEKKIAEVKEKNWQEFWCRLREKTALMSGRERQPSPEPPAFSEPQPSPEPPALSEPQLSPEPPALSEPPALPDFSHMESYTQTITFDVSWLYSFLIDEGVIVNIDEQLFTDCISHAYMNKVWEAGKHHKLKCVIRHLKDHFPDNWIRDVAKRMGTTKKKITAFDRDKIGEFEKKLRDII